MLTIIGEVEDADMADEVVDIGKIVIVGNRARKLGKRANENQQNLRFK